MRNLDGTLITTITSTDVTWVVPTQSAAFEVPRTLDTDARLSDLLSEAARAYSSVSERVLVGDTFVTTGGDISDGSDGDGGDVPPEPDTETFEPDEVPDGTGGSTGGGGTGGGTTGGGPPPNQNPVTDDEAAVTLEDTPLIVAATDPNALLVGDADPDGGTLSVTGFTIAGIAYLAGTSAVLPQGTLTINADGSYSFSPAADFNGDVPEIIYTISDGEGGVATGILDLDVTPVNDSPETGEVNRDGTEDTVLEGSVADAVDGG